MEPDTNNSKKGSIMKTNMLQRAMTVAVLAALMPAGRVLVAAEQPTGGSDKAATTNERVAAIVQSLRESGAKLKQYEWFETTVVAVNGEEKMRKQNRCYHGEDGVLQKVPVAAAPAPQKKRGLRGRIAEKKQKEMGDYMQQVIGMVHLYVPPDPKRLQAMKEKGNISIQILSPGKRIRLDFHNYRQPQDRLGVEVDLNTNRLLGLSISSYVGTPKDAFTCNAKFAGLKDGTTYLAETVLDAKAKNVKVTVKNSGYRKMVSDLNK